MSGGSGLERNSLDSRYILKVELTEFADKLDVKRKKRN